MFENRKEQVQKLVELEGIKPVKIIRILEPEIREAVSSFVSYKTIQKRIKDELGIEIKYPTLANEIKSLLKGGKKAKNKVVEEVKKADDVENKLSKILNLKK